MLRRRDGDDWSGPARHHVPRTGSTSDDPPDESTTSLLHLTTLFPPVRPRGWFEVRYLDAQPWRWWPVPMAVLTALVEDPDASAAAARAPAPGSTTGTAAARDGLAAPGLHDAAARLLRRRAAGAGAPRRAPRPGRPGRGVPRPLRRPALPADDPRRRPAGGFR